MITPQLWYAFKVLKHSVLKRTYQLVLLRPQNCGTKRQNQLKQSEDTTQKQEKQNQW